MNVNNALGPTSYGALISNSIQESGFSTIKLWYFGNKISSKRKLPRLCTD